MTTVADLYDQVCYDLLEPATGGGPGLSLGLVTQQDFLDYLGLVLMNFLSRTGIAWKVYTQQITTDNARYTVPDSMSYVYYVFQNAVIVDKIDLFSNYIAGSWKYNPGKTKAYHEDGLPVKTLELIPAPNWTGSAISDSTSFSPGSRGITFVGNSLATQETWSISDTLNTIPDSATPYLVFGILEKIFSADAESRDGQRAYYCRTRYEEGISLWSSIILSMLGEQQGER